MNEIEKKIADWAWELYSKYIIAANYSIDDFHADEFERCLKHAKYMHETAQGFSENE